MIGSLFNAQTGDVDLQQKDINGRGEYFVNSGVQNCGIKGRTDRVAKIFPANTITIDFLGNAYYRPFAYKMATHNHVFSLNGDVLKNELVGLYISAQMSYLSKVYSFNNMGTWSRIKEQEICLPVTKEGNIDLIFIEERVRELEEERVRELEAYLHNAGFKDCTLSKEEQSAILKIRSGNIKYVQYKIDRLFEIATGRDVIIGRIKEGVNPLISHQHDNNGITKRVKRIDNRRLFNYKTTLPLADRGVFLATTQAENFHIGTRVKALTFKDGEKTESVRLFFVTLINRLQILFVDYLTNATDNLPNLQIAVPVNTDGNIDYSLMENYINAVKKECIGTLKQEIEREHSVHGKVIANKKENPNAYIIDKTANNHVDIEYEPQIAAEPFGRCKWEGFDQSIRDFFGCDQTILVGCYKGKKYREWIDAHHLYNVRMGKTKGSMEANRELFDNTSLLVLYEMGKPDKLSAYKIVEHREIGKEELIEMGYPNKKPRKSYMSFSLEPLDMDLTFLVEHHLIERLIELDADHAKGTPIFIEP